MRRACFCVHRVIRLIRVYRVIRIIRVHRVIRIIRVYRVVHFNTQIKNLKMPCKYETHKQFKQSFLSFCEDTFAIPGSAVLTICRSIMDRSVLSRLPFPAVCMFAERILPSRSAAVKVNLLT